MRKSVADADNALTHVDEKKEDARIHDGKYLLEYDGDTLIVTYSKRPLGLDVESGDNGIGLYVIASHNSEVQNIKKGMQLVKINKEDVSTLRAVKVLEKVHATKTPLEIQFSLAIRTRSVRPSRITVTRGLSLRIVATATAEALASGLIRVYIPNGTPVTVELGKYDLKTIVQLVCKKNGLIPEKLVLVMQHREKENDIQHPSLDESAKNWEEKFAENYRLRLISKKLAERYQEGVPIDGVSILTKNGFTDADIEQLRKFMNMLLHLSTDAAMAALHSTLRDEYDNLKLTNEEVKAIVLWHKNIVQVEDNILMPSQHCIRVIFERPNLKQKVYHLKDSMTTAGALCEIISKDLHISNPEMYSLHIKGLSDIRAFEQALSPEDIPNQVKAAVVKSGGYGRLQFVYKETREFSDSDDDSTAEREEIGFAPTAKAFRVGSIDAWSDKDLDTLRIAMEEHMREMELQEEEVKISKAEEEKSALHDIRLELLKECVKNQHQLSEVIYNFDASSVKNFPAHKKLQNLRVGDIMIVTDTDQSGWARGKKLAGGAEAYFPASYVELVAKPEMLVEVVHDFDPQNVQCLPKALTVIPLKRSELILVTGTHVSGWWRGCKVEGGPEGYFPGDYTRCITQPPLDVTFSKIYGEPVKDGHLKLRVGIFKRFQEKYVFLTKNELIYFNSEDSDPQTPAGRIALRHPSLKSTVVRTKRRFFTIHVGRKSYECKADQTEVSGWIDTLEALL